jgi:uncharacterized protein YbjT (DUF2867 family)
MPGTGHGKDDMKVTVFGGTGFVGSYLVDALVERGHTPRLLVRAGSEGKVRHRAQCEIVTGDIGDAKSVAEALAGADAAIYNIGLLREFPARGITWEAMHYEGAARAIDAATDAGGVKRFVLMSANGAKPEGTGYQVTKYRAEQYLSRSGLDWTVFRPSVVFGDPRGREEFCSMLRDQMLAPPVPAPLFHEGIWPAGAGRFCMSPVAIQDVAQAFVRSLGDAGEPRADFSARRSGCARVARDPADHRGGERQGKQVHAAGTCGRGPCRRGAVRRLRVVSRDPRAIADAAGRQYLRRQRSVEAVRHHAAALLPRVARLPGRPQAVSKARDLHLVFGASGYIGGHLVPKLLAGRQAGAGRRARRGVAGPDRLGGVERKSADALRPETLGPVLAGRRHGAITSCTRWCGARISASSTCSVPENFAAAAARAGVRRIVYLGGLIPADARSEHLLSRKETGDRLRAGPVPVTEIRAGIIVGPGSAAFEVIRDLVNALPAMVTPRWVRARTPPIALDNLLEYLVRISEHPGAAGRSTTRRARGTVLRGTDADLRRARGPHAVDRAGAGAVADAVVVLARAW